MNNFIFYDTETSGVKELDFIQVIQFAAIQTDENFRSINSFNELCRPLTLDSSFTESSRS